MASAGVVIRRDIARREKADGSHSKTARLAGMSRVGWPAANSTKHLVNPTPCATRQASEPDPKQDRPRGDLLPLFDVDLLHDFATRFTAQLKLIKVLKIHP
jgi:hypothetical protein